MPDKSLPIRFVRNFTVEPIAEALKPHAAALGLELDPVFGAYDNVVPEILEAAIAPPDILIIALDLEFFAGGLYNPHWTLAQARDELENLFGAVESLPPQTLVLFTTFLPPFTRPFPWAPEHPILGRAAAAFSLNELIRAFVAAHPTLCGLLDFERLAAQLGEASTIDRRFGLMMKAPLRQPFAEQAAAEIARFLRLRVQPAKKVLVLDCDNTLWGGVVGECGVDGIALDPYEYPGIAYYRFQFEILTFFEQGVLICLCSKNDEAAVWEVLDRHPHSLLKRSHLAGYRINWEDKASNIKNLAAELNLSIDSMVFVDDNPVECELIRSTFPDLTVLQVPGKIYHLPGMVAATGLFDRLALSKEDRERTRYYQAEQDRREIRKKHVDTEGFLRDLAMRAVVRAPEAVDIPRASQLCQRTNQFNVTTRRYTEAELETLRHDPNVRIFMLEAADRFGPVGFSGLLILAHRDSRVEVDTFLLSCRIIGRKFDHALFCEGLRRAAADWKFDEIWARFLPTPKNGVVSSLWTEYGFQSSPETGEGLYHSRLADLKVRAPDIIQLSDKL